MGEEERSCLHLGTEARIVPERLPCQVQLAFSFYTLKPQGGVSKQLIFHRRLRGSQPFAFKVTFES